MEDKYIWSENYLLSQRYSKEVVDKYFHIDEEIIKRTKQELFESFNKTKEKNRKCIYLVGQPGCGKSTTMKNDEYNSYIILDIDSYRALYPYRDELVAIIKENHKFNELPTENTEGRDFTNFTRKFIGLLMDELFEWCVSNGYNIALQKHMATYDAHESSFKDLKELGYETKVFLPSVSSKVSWERCIQRNAVNNLSLNTVSKDFHDKSVASISETITGIAKHYVFEDKLIKEIKIFKDKEITIINDDDVINYDELKLYIEENLK